MKDTYLSIKSPAAAELKEKGSKFLSFAYPVSSESAVKEVLAALKEKYWDASHHCYAYMLGFKYEIFRANDAGEPNHSAGDPILSQIRSLNITDVLVVVVRYFGGTKLGVPGLISAYKTAAREVLSQALVVEKHLTVTLKVRFIQEQTNLIMKTIKNLEVEVVEHSFDYESVKTILVINIRKSMEEEFLTSLQGSLGIEITDGL